MTNAAAAAMSLDDVRIALVEYFTDRRIEMQDLEAGIPDAFITSQELAIAAQYYAWSYQGSFSFMLDMQAACKRYGRLTPAQIKGTLNCLRAEEQRNAAKAQQAAAKPEIINQPEQAPAKAIEGSSIENGIYTIRFDDGEYRTIKITKGWAALEEGKQVAKYLAGSDNEAAYQGFAFIEGSKAQVWKRYADNKGLALALGVLMGSRDAQLEAGKAYAQQSGNCFICNRTLTTPESLDAGIGPHCAAKIGL